MTQPPSIAAPPVAATPVPFPPGGGSQLVDRGNTLVTGWSFSETTGLARAELRLVDGGDANGLRVVRITLNPGESRTDPLGSFPLLFTSGIFVVVVAGSIEGSVWTVNL